MTLIKKTAIEIYRFLMPKLQALSPRLWAKLQYRYVYGKPCHLSRPRTFSEKLLWLWLNTYRGNPTIMRLCDKYEVREYIKECGFDDILNELYFVTDDPSSIRYEDLPGQFVLKLSQGWNTNLLCKNKEDLQPHTLRDFLHQCSQGNYFYDIGAARIGGVKRKELHKHYICERYLSDESQSIPIDYKVYCFHGQPKAILYIAGRFKQKKGCFMSPEWDYQGCLNDTYQRMITPPERPPHLSQMLEYASKLSAPFPFVRVDFYDIGGKLIFGEMTFFPNGCIGMQETSVGGHAMTELLQLDIGYQKRRM